MTEESKDGFDKYLGYPGTGYLRSQRDNFISQFYEELGNVSRLLDYRKKNPDDDPGRYYWLERSLNNMKILLNMMQTYDHCINVVEDHHKRKRKRKKKTDG